MRIWSQPFRNHRGRHETDRRHLQARRFPGFEQLECRRLLAFVPFSAEVILTKTDGATHVDGADFDGDGDMDILATNPAWVGWHENTNGAGAFSAGRTIATDLESASVSIPIDIDGDGDVDVVNEEKSRGISWYENLDGQGTFGPKQVIQEDRPGVGILGAGLSMDFTDFDQDGDLDILMATNFRGISWYENVDGHGKFASPQILVSWRHEFGMDMEDMDGDGDDDVVTWEPDHRVMNWYEKLDDGRISESGQLISDVVDVGRLSTRPRVADLDGDGDVDFVVKTDGALGRVQSGLVWLENLGTGGFASPRMLLAAANVRTLVDDGIRISDMDGDGDQDVLIRQRGNRFSTFINLDGKGTFSEPIQIENQLGVNVSFNPADVDGDGDQDILYAENASKTLSWQENLDGARYGSEQTITGEDSKRTVTHIRAADLDTDGDLDILTVSAEDGKVSWHENVNGQGHFGGRRLITLDAKSLKYLDVSDLENDGDVDIVYSLSGLNSIMWLENQNGRGQFGQPSLLASEGREISSFFTVDVDGDGDQDILTTFSGDHDIGWYENSSQQGTLGPRQTLGLSASEVSFIHAGDIDRDGDIDVISGSQADRSVTWFENTDGRGVLGDERVIASQIDGLTSLVLVDADADGDLDALATVDREGVDLLFKGLIWFENTDGDGQFQTREMLSYYGSNYIHVADLDRERTLELVSRDPQSGTLTWLENAFGASTFRETEIRDRIASIDIADLNGDGDADMVAGLWQSDRDVVIWYRNELPSPTRFAQEHMIGEREGTPMVVIASDLDGDGDLDAITARSSPDEVAWHENLDGRGTLGAKRAIVDADDPGSLFSGDFDGDGDNDLLTESTGTGLIEVHRNLDGAGTIGEPLFVGRSEGTRSVVGEDIDGDGDLDVLVSKSGSIISSTHLDNKVTWYENLDGQGTFGRERVIDDTIGDLGEVQAADIDGDGDKDVLLSVFQQSLNEDQSNRFRGAVVWYQNRDAKGNFGGRKDIDVELRLVHSAVAADLDRDGDQDVIVGDLEKIAWFENLDGLGHSAHASSLPKMSGPSRRSLPRMWTVTTIWTSFPPHASTTNWLGTKMLTDVVTSVRSR